MNHSETKKSNSLILKSFRLYVNKFIIIIIPKASVYSYFQVGISTDNAFWRPTDWIFGYPSPPFASFNSICGFPANCSCEINCRQLFVILRWIKRYWRVNFNSLPKYYTFYSGGIYFCNFEYNKDTSYMNIE